MDVHLWHFKEASVDKESLRCLGLCDLLARLVDSAVAWNLMLGVVNQLILVPQALRQELTPPFV